MHEHCTACLAGEFAADLERLGLCCCLADTPERFLRTGQMLSWAHAQPHRLGG